MKSYYCEFFGEKSRPDSHKVEKNPSLTLLCELVHHLGNFLSKVTLRVLLGKSLDQLVVYYQCWFLIG